MTKKKLWVSFVSLVLVVVVGVASIFSVIASLNANVDSNFKITYQANNVNALISGAWVLGNPGNNQEYVGSNQGQISAGGKQYLEFTPDQSEISGAFDPFEIDLVYSNKVTDAADWDSPPPTDAEPKILTPTIMFCVANYSETPMPLKITYTATHKNISSKLTIVSSFPNNDETNSKTLIDSGTIETEVPYSGVSSQKELFEELVIFAIQNSDNTVETGFIYMVIYLLFPLIFDYESYLNALDKLNIEGSPLAGQVTRDNWVESYSGSITELEGLPANEETYSLLQEKLVEQFDVSEIQNYLNDLNAHLYFLLLIMLTGKENIIGDPPPFTLIYTTYDVESEIVDASASGSFDFALGLF